MKAVFIILAFLAVAGCRKANPSAESPRKDDVVHTPTALIAVIADPVRFHGKTVSIDGFYRHGFEVSGIFPSRDMSFSESNGLWLDREKDVVIEPQTTDPIWRDMNPLWLQVEGVIDADSHGHLGAWTGTIRAKKIRAYPVDMLDDRTK